jgi:hypothetical protein
MRMNARGKYERRVESVVIGVVVVDLNKFMVVGFSLLFVFSRCLTLATAKV